MVRKGLTIVFTFVCAFIENVQTRLYTSENAFPSKIPHSISTYKKRGVLARERELYPALLQRGLRLRGSFSNWKDQNRVTRMFSRVYIYMIHRFNLRKYRTNAPTIRDRGTNDQSRSSSYEEKLARALYL